MATYTYLSLWFRDFTIDKGLAHLEALLTLFPASAARPGFRLLVRSLDQAQSPSLEADLLLAPADVRAAAAEFLHNDTAYEVTAHWDLWQPRTRSEWEEAPSPVEFLLYGEEFDTGRYPAERDHVLINLGHEHFYLVPADRTQKDSLRYIRENVRRLYAYVRPLGKQLLPAEQRLWSEGDPDFAQRTEQILANCIRLPGRKSRP